MEHNQLFQLLITFVMSGASAWGGAKYALRYLEKTTDKHDKAIQAMQCGMQKLVSLEHCKDSKVNCKADTVVRITELLSKIDKLSVDILDQNRRREDSKDENQKVYLDISNKLTRLETKVESLLETNH